jgi:lipopolysaccharide assembly protein A
MEGFMQAIRTLLWVFFAVIIAIFSMENWTRIRVSLWPLPYNVETSLPVLIITAFLAGSLPLWLLYRATKWRMERKLENSERALADMRAVASAHSAAASGTASMNPQTSDTNPPPAEMLAP